LRLEQLVQSEQGWTAPHLIAHELVRQARRLAARAHT
jgi:hypothetical protein